MLKIAAFVYARNNQDNEASHPYGRQAQISLTETVILSLPAQRAYKHEVATAKNRPTEPKQIANRTCLTSTKDGPCRFFALLSGHKNSLRSACARAGRLRMTVLLDPSVTNMPYTVP